MPQPSRETPVSFEASLPPAIRGGCWLARLTVSLTLDMPDGPARRFHVRYCPQRGIEAWNVSDGLLPDSEVNP
jgi:hypothetical protein